MTKPDNRGLTQFQFRVPYQAQLIVQRIDMSLIIDQDKYIVSYLVDSQDLQLFYIRLLGLSACEHRLHFVYDFAVAIIQILCSVPPLNKWYLVLFYTLYVQQLLAYHLSALQFCYHYFVVQAEIDKLYGLPCRHGKVKQKLYLLFPTDVVYLYVYALI